MIKEVIEYIHSLDLSPFITGLLTLIVGLSYKFRDNIYYILNNKVLSLKASLECHDLFSTIDVLREIDLKNIHFVKSPPKTKIFRDFMIAKFNAIENASRLMVTEKYYKKNEIEFSTDIKKIITTIVKEYTEVAHYTFIQKGLTQEQAEHVIDMFNSWHEDTVKSVISRTESILENNFYTTNFQKTVAIFEVFAMASELTLSDGVKSFEKLNGYFDTVKYD